MKPKKVAVVNDDNNNTSLYITSRVLNVFQCWMGGYGTLTLLKQPATPALKALKHIKNTGQAEWCRARRGTLHQLLILSWCALSFIFLPTEMRSWGPLLPTGTWHQHLHTHVVVTPLPLGSSERTKAKNLPFEFCQAPLGILVVSEVDFLPMRDWGGTNSVKQGLLISPLCQMRSLRTSF